MDELSIYIYIYRTSCMYIYLSIYLSTYIYIYIYILYQYPCITKSIGCGKCRHPNSAPQGGSSLCFDRLHSRPCPRCTGTHPDAALRRLPRWPGSRLGQRLDNGWTTGAGDQGKVTNLWRFHPRKQGKSRRTRNAKMI